MVYINGTDTGWTCVNAVNGKCGLDILLDPGVILMIIIIVIVGLVAVRILLKAKEIRVMSGEGGGGDY